MLKLIGNKLECVVEDTGDGVRETVEASVLGSELLVGCSGDRALLLAYEEDKETKSSNFCKQLRY